MIKPYIDFETERLHIRSVTKEDKEDFMALRIHNSVISSVYSEVSGFEDLEWESELNSEKDIYLSIFRKTDEVFVASASIQAYEKTTIELGYDVSEAYRNRGYATEIIRGLGAEVHRKFPGARVIIRIEKDNIASRKAAEKGGGILTQNEDSLVNQWFAKLKDLCNDETKNEIGELLEQGKDSVCVYEIP